jgi:hypothetical protein
MAPRVVMIVVDGLPCDLLAECLPDLPFISSRLTHHAEAVSCFPSTTGPAYFPLLAGVTPGRANITGIRWFDRSRPTRTRFPHRGLRSYVGPDAKKMSTDTVADTVYRRHAWPASSPVGKDIDKRGGEKSRDLIWAFAHFTDRWDLADLRTAWKLERGLKKGRPIVFAVFPSVDEYGHMQSIALGRPREALQAIDALLADKLADFEGELMLTADHGLTDTHTHLDLRGLVEAEVGTTLAFPLTAVPNPAAVVCESGNGMAHVYLRGESSWAALPSPERCQALAAALLKVEGIDSIALRGPGAGAELWTPAGVGEVGFADGLYQRGPAFSSSYEHASPAVALAHSHQDERPDAAFALTSLFASERTGDLLVSAKVGYDLRTRREWPEHHASHGAIHRAHTVVPLLSSAPLPTHPLRTLDAFTHMLELAEVPLADYPDSDVALLAAGQWSPGVLR